MMSEGTPKESRIAVMWLPDTRGVALELGDNKDEVRKQAQALANSEKFPVTLVVTLFREYCHDGDCVNRIEGYDETEVFYPEEEVL